jgi:hypothetical protein
MIRKPPGDWNRRDESAAVRTVRTASAVAEGGARVARRGGQAMAGLFSFFFAALWGFAAIASGLDGHLPTLIGAGAMAAFAFWFGCRSFRKARATSD